LQAQGPSFLDVRKIGTDCTFKRFRCRPFSSSSINIKAFALGFSVSFVSSVVKGFWFFVALRISGEIQLPLNWLFTE